MTGIELAAYRYRRINDTHANLWGGGDTIFRGERKHFAPFRGSFIENNFSDRLYNLNIQKA